MSKARSGILFATLIAALAFGGITATAHASPGPLGLDWTSSSTAGMTTITGNTLSFAYNNGDPGPGVPTQTFTFSTIAPSSGGDSMSLLWNNYAANFLASTTLTLEDFTTGSSTTLFNVEDTWGGYSNGIPINVSNYPINASINYNAGDIWGFQISSGNYDSTSIINGSLVFQTPEPSGLAFLIFPCLGVLAVVRRKLMA